MLDISRKGSIGFVLDSFFYVGERQTQCARFVTIYFAQFNKFALQRGAFACRDAHGAPGVAEWCAFCRGECGPCGCCEGVFAVVGPQRAT